MSSTPDATSGALPAEVDFLADAEASPERMNRAMGYLLALIRAAGARLPELEALASDLQANGLTRIAEALGPVYERAVAIDAHLQSLEAQYLGAGVVPAILADAKIEAARQLTAYVAEHDDAFAAYKAAAVIAFAAAAHRHQMADIDGLQDALDAKRSTSLELFSTSGTWVRPNNLVAALVAAIGGGGGGGSGYRFGAYGGTVYYGGGAGGGGGGRTQLVLRAADLGATETVTIGAGGVGGAASAGAGNAGLAGGSSSFGNHVRGGGGAGGQGGSNFGEGGQLARGGAGGVGTDQGGAGAGLEGGPAPTFNGAGAGGGGAGEGYQNGPVPAVAGSIARVSAASQPLGAGVAIPGVRHGGGGGGGGGTGVAGFPGGGPGGGGGGGGSTPPTNAVSGAGGAGASGACLILNLF